MKLNLTLEFDSVAEMQDWILSEAKALAAERIAAPPEAEPADVVAEPAEVAQPEPKPKRKRRTRKEMEAARAAAEAAVVAVTGESEPASEPVAEVAPPAEVEAPAGGNGSEELAGLQKRFMALMARDPHAAVAELDRVVGPSGKFSQCAVDVQKEILKVLEARQ